MSNQQQQQQQQSTIDLTPFPQSQNRPKLPESRANPYLRSLNEEDMLVKFQTIVREGKDIVVGRIKVPTPGRQAHAFILRRYDTDAISLTTMFKVAFPGAPDENDEKREMEWVRSAYDTSNTNGARGSEVVKLAGQWIDRRLAIHLADAYNLRPLIHNLARAVPDPTVAYRKSQRSQQASADTPRDAPVPSITAKDVASPAPKRVRLGSEVAPTPTTAGSSEAPRQLTLEATTTITAPSTAQLDMEAEIEKSKQLVLDLKRELRLRSAAGEELEEQGYEVVGEGSRGTKRGNKEDEGVVISGGAGKTERVIRKNKRVEVGTVNETAKKVAWGAVIFGLGIGAATLLPQFTSAFF